MQEAEYNEEARRLRPEMLRVARRYVSADEAEDVVQDALVRLWEMRESLSAPLDKLAGVMSRNLCIDRLRRRKPTTSPEGLEITDSETGDDYRYEAIMRIADQLPVLQQAAFRMRHIDGMRYEDMAEMLSTTPENARQLVSRARRAILKQYIKQ